MDADARKKHFEGERAPLEAAENAARSLARKVEAEVPKGWGFALFLFGNNQADGLGTYISNLDRASVVSATRELLEFIERRTPSL